MKKLTRSNIEALPNKPIKIVQFGEGNFLRAFADWVVDIMNERIGFNAGVAVVQPIETGLVELLQRQDGLYHHLMMGMSSGERIRKFRLISCIQHTVNPFQDKHAFWELAAGDDLEIVISNTTEAGIVFDESDLPKKGVLAHTFPGKLTQFLVHRFDHFDGDPTKGVIFLPCELIDRNGDKLKQAILDYCHLWRLSRAFVHWIENYNYFGNTLVDRIVPGYPRNEIDDLVNEIGFEDKLLVSSEVFHLWVIEGDKELQKRFPADSAGLNVKFVDDQMPYRTRKVRILNGIHTSMVSIGLNTELETVKKSIEHPLFGAFYKKLIKEEILPTIDLTEDERNSFASEVIERFQNPFIRHELSSISLNSISKFKVRGLPIILDYIGRFRKAPPKLSLVFAGLIHLYISQAASRKLKDNPGYIEFFTKIADRENHVFETLKNGDLWGSDLTQNKVLFSEVQQQYSQIQSIGIGKAIEQMLK